MAFTTRLSDTVSQQDRRGAPAGWSKAVSGFEADSNQSGVHTTHVDWSNPPKQ